MKPIHFKDSRIPVVLDKVEQYMIDLFKSKLESVILFGSYSREENTDESDIDIMVLINEDGQELKKYESNITDIMVDLSLEFGVVVSLYIESSEYYREKVNILPFLMNIEKQGIKIYG